MQTLLFQLVPLIQVYLAHSTLHSFVLGSSGGLIMRVQKLQSNEVIASDVFEGDWSEWVIKTH